MPEENKWDTVVETEATETETRATEAATETRDLPIVDVDGNHKEQFAVMATVEVRVKNGKEVIVGHIPYDTVSHPLGDRGEFREVLKPGVFREHLAAKPEVVAKYDHGNRGMGLPLGRTSTGTLSVSEHPDGLHYEIEPPDTTEGRDLMTSIKRGDLNGTSFGFRAKQERWTRATDGTHLRELHKAELTDVSPTPDPAYPNTNVKVALRGLQSVDAAEYRRLMEVQERDDSIKPGHFVRWFQPAGETSARTAIGKVIETRNEGKLMVPGTDLAMEGHRSNPVHMVCEYRELPPQQGGDWDNALRSLPVYEPSGHVHLVRERNLEKLDNGDVPTDEDMVRMADAIKAHEMKEVQEQADRLRLLERAPSMTGPSLDGSPSYE